MLPKLIMKSINLFKVQRLFVVVAVVIIIVVVVVVLSKMFEWKFFYVW